MTQSNAAVQSININNTERLVSLLCGSALLIDGIFDGRKRMIKLIGGAYLFYRGATGYCRLVSLVERNSVMRNRNVNTAMAMEGARDIPILDAQPIGYTT